MTTTPATTTISLDPKYPRLTPGLHLMNLHLHLLPLATLAVTKRERRTRKPRSGDLRASRSQTRALHWREEYSPDLEMFLLKPPRLTPGLSLNALF